MEKDKYSEKFKQWLDICMKSNNIESYSELANKIGVSRRSLCAWMKDPTKIRKYVLAGMMYILNVRNITLNSLCYMFGIE